MEGTRRHGCVQERRKRRGRRHQHCVLTQWSETTATTSTKYLACSPTLCRVSDRRQIKSTYSKVCANNPPQKDVLQTIGLNQLTRRVVAQLERRVLKCREASKHRSLPAVKHAQ